MGRTSHRPRTIDSPSSKSLREASGVLLGDQDEHKP